MSEKAERLKRMIRAYDRTPFQEALVALLEAAPDKETLEDFAKRHPDRWMQSIKVAGALSGYIEHQQLDIGLVDVSSLSDSQLEERIKQRTRELRKAGVVLDGEPVALVAAEPEKVE